MKPASLVLSRLLNFFWFFPFFLPTYLIKIPLGKKGTLSLLDLFLLAGIIFFAATFLFQRQKFSFKKLFALFPPKFLLGLIFIFSGFLVSFWLNFEKYSSFWDGLGLIKSFFVLPIGFSFLFWARFGKEFSLVFKKILLFLFGYSSLLAIIGTFFWIRGKTTFDKRISIFFESPNFLATSLSIGILAGLFLLWIRFLQKKTSTNLSILKDFLFKISLCLLLFHLISLFGSYSLGGWLATFIATTFFSINVFFYSKTKNFILLWAKVLFLFLAIFSFFLVSPIFLNFAQKQAFFLSGSNLSRLAIYQASSKIIASNWLSGIGPKNFQPAYLESQKFFAPFPQWAVPHCHNFVLQTFIEGGLFGLIGILLVFFSLAEAIKNTLRSNQDRPIAVFLASFWSYFSVHSLVDATFWNNDHFFLFWFFAFSTLALESDFSKKKPLLKRK